MIIKRVKFLIIYTITCFFFSCNIEFFNPFLGVYNAPVINISALSRITNASDISEKPCLVWTGSEYGVCWCDYRDGNYEIYFARIDAGGNLVAGSEVRISNAVGSSVDPGLVWTGSEYGISWEDNRSGDYEIYFARIDAGGNLVAGSERNITNNNTSNSFDPSLVWTGTEYGVSWDDTRNGNLEIYFARINSSGNLVPASEIRITNASDIREYPSLVWTGSEYGVSWQDHRNTNWEIYFARIDAGGNLVAGSETRVTNFSGTSNSPSTVWTGSEYGVAWHDNRDGNYEIYFARIDASGNLVPLSEIRITNASDISEYPDLVWTGSGYGVAWYDNRDLNTEIYFALIDTGGNLIAGSEERITDAAGSSVDPGLVWTGTVYGISWGDDRDGNSEIYFGALVK